MNIEIATKIETVLNDGFVNRKEFVPERAELYSVKTNEQGDVVVALEQAWSDVYNLLDSDEAREVAQQGDIALVTGGWAAPCGPDAIDFDGPPSEHPEKRRVRLVVCASRNNVCSAMRFGDDVENVITDDGKARGSLNDAVLELMASANS